MVRILRSVRIGAEAEGQAQDVTEIDRPDDLGDIADLGLNLSEMQRLLAGLRQDIVAAHVREPAARRPTFSRVLTRGRRVPREGLPGARGRDALR